MADVRETVQVVTTSSITPAYTGSLSTSDTYLVRNNGRVLLHFKKSAAVNDTVTISTPGSVGGNAIADLTFTLEASTGDRMVGPFPPSIYNDSVQDLRITHSDIDGVTQAAIQL